MHNPVQIRRNTGGKRFSEPRIALIHYWYFRSRGGERVFDVIADIFPGADVFMLLCDPNALPPSVRAHRISTSFLNRLPGVKKYYRTLLPFFPLALEQFNLTEYDIVISHEAGPAKGVLTRADARHICYCHTPMRYLWDMYHDYLETAPAGSLGKAIYALSCHYVRKWDYLASARVDEFVASSQNSARRIQKYYRRDARVIYPPVNVGKFQVAEEPGRDFYLVVSPLVEYKRIDLAIDACNKLRKRLVIIGDGEKRKALQRIAGPTISFLGFQPDEVVLQHYSNCKALLFPGEEDIGLTPIEAQASGRPVIAYACGGVLETVLGLYPGELSSPEERTGVFFQEQSSESLAEAILAFEAIETKFSPQFIRRNALRFDENRFRQQFAEFVALGQQANNFSALERKELIPAD
jgi:glycosyltransferase involved in cell wall biosynthesis